MVPAGLIAYGVSRGAAPEALFSAMGLSPEDLADPEQPVRAAVMLPLWRALLEHFRGEPLAVQMAEGADLAMLGLVGQVIRHSPTIRGAIERTLRFQRLYDPGLVTAVTEANGQVTFSVSHVEAVRELGAPIAFMAAASLTWLRQLAGTRVNVLEAQLEVQPRGDPAAYERFFGGLVRFGCPETRLVIDAALLERPVPGADPNLLRHLSAYADGLLAQRPEGDRALPLPERVRRALAEGLLQGNLAPRAVAKGLAMSTRTLQRRLASSQTSLQALCEEVRRDAALRLLRDPANTIHEVAFSLGYQDVPSFYRAFKRWTDTTPAEIRRRLTAP